MMYTVKNLTNSPHKIQTVDGFARLGAREEAEIDVHPNMVRPYSQLGYLVLTKVADSEVDETTDDAVESEEQVEAYDEEAEESEPSEVELNDPEPEVVEVKSEEAAEEEKAEELDEKDVLIAQLKDLGVKADKRSSVKKLQEKLDEALAK